MKIIDISEHNGDINFKKLKNENIKGIIIRMGWIGNHENHTLDKKFIQNIRNCKTNGLPFGIYVYSYCKNKKSVLSGAKWVVNKLKDYCIKPSLPIFIDMEDNTIRDCGKENLTSQVDIFCNYIESNTKFKSGVYANLNWFNNYLDVNKLKNYKIWLAEYNNKNIHSATFRVDLWQYTSKGKISGINGYVDLNVCLECNNISQEEITGKKEDFEMAKLYQNGSTKESVFQDKNCTKEIGYLHPQEIAECYGIIDNKAIICYNVDNSNNKKVGFVKWLGGIK